MSQKEVFEHLNRFEKSLSLVPKHLGACLLTRHSIREEVAGHNAHYKLPLTENGRILARKWGEAQILPIHSLVSSPVQRCIDTARLMAGDEGEVKINQLLTEPGCFVDDIHKVNDIFMEHGPVSFIGMLLREELEGVKAPLAGTKQVLRHLLKHIPSEAGLSVSVTHDTILAAVVYTLLNKAHLEDSDWPSMMEGMYLWREHHYLHWVWREEVYKTELAEIFNQDELAEFYI